jgi:hypothetical protein
VEIRSTAAVSATPAATPRLEKRAGNVMIGNSRIGIAGLVGPPVSAIPTPIRTWALTMVAATTYSGCALRSMNGDRIA